MEMDEALSSLDPEQRKQIVMSQKFGGETNVLHILLRATSQNPEILKAAEKELQSLETTPGFYSILKDVFMETSLHPNIRLLSLIYFKNATDKYWRPTAPNAIPEEEKIRIRSDFLSSIPEPHNVVAAHVAVLIGRMARYDFPHSWPELVPTLMTTIKSNDSLMQNRGLMILNQVIKVLESKKMLNHRRIFEKLTDVIFADIVQIWDALCQVFTAKVQEYTNSGQNVGNIMSYLEQTDGIRYLESILTATKIAAKLALSGVSCPTENECFDRFLQRTFVHARFMLHLRKAAGGDNVLLEKFVVRCMKIHLSFFVQSAKFNYVNCITPALEFAVVFAFADEGQPYLFEKFLISLFDLVKKIILIHENKQALSRYYRKSDPEVNTNKQSAMALRDSFFTAPMLVEILKKLVTYYFILTPQELELWRDDPESYALASTGGDAPEHCLRPGMESLFTALFHQHVKTLAPVMVDLIRETAVMVSPDDNQAILQKDAVYLAAGLVAFDLYDEVDFDGWLVSTLLEELKVKHSNYRIIRRRTVWLIGRWFNVKLSAANQPAVYSALIDLLRNEEDMVVRLAASGTICSVLEDFFFSEESETFTNFLGGFYDALFMLLKDVEYCDTKLQVLQVLNVVIERSGVKNLETYYSGLVQYLPVVWAESENHNLLRVAVVASLGKLVKILGHLNHSKEVYDFILNVISLSTDPDQSSHVYLLEDGLDLWLAVIENIPGPTDDLLLLFKNLLRVLGISTENLKVCNQIIRAYAVLAPEQFLQVYGVPVVENLGEQLSELLPEGIKCIMTTFETFLIADRHFSVNLIKPILPFVFKAVHRADEKFELTGMYFSIISRVLLESQETFVEVIRSIAPSLGQTENDVLLRIVDFWLEYMPVVSQLPVKKLLAMALCSLIISDLNFLYNKFSGILLAVGEALADLNQNDEEDALYEMVEEAALDIGEGEEHAERLRALLRKDVIHQVTLRNFLKSHMVELERRVDLNMFNQLVQNVDSETLSLVNVFDKLDLAPSAK